MPNQGKECRNHQEQKRGFLDELYDKIWIIDELIIYLEYLIEKNKDNCYLKHIREKMN